MRLAKVSLKREATNGRDNFCMKLTQKMRSENEVHETDEGVTL